MEKRGQLFRRMSVLLSVVSRARSSHGSGFTYPQHRLPTKLQGPHSIGGLLAVQSGVFKLCEADFAIERERSGAVKGEHDSECYEREDVVVDSEALMDADIQEGDEHVDCDERGCEAGE